MQGEPLPIISMNENSEETSKRVKLYMKNIRKVFLDPRIGNNKIMVVSMNGPKKTGKSFFMNICIKYLQKRIVDTIISNHELMTGFQLGLSMENSTHTIFIWSEPFIIESTSKMKVAVLLLDCQCSLYSKAFIKETFAINAFLQILSSLQIYNIFNQVLESNLHWLAFNCNYSGIAKTHVDGEMESKSHKPYQTLCFLIRDWPCPYEFFYGSAGGQQYINRFLSTQNKNMPDENISLRDYLNSQYSHFNCYLMPHPKVGSSSTNNFNGKWGELSNEFQENVLEFMENVFSPHNLAVKEIGGKQITALDMVNQIEAYYIASILAENPNPVSGFDGCAKTHHYKILEDCLNHYRKLMTTRHLNIQSAELFLAFHEESKISTLQMFDVSLKFGMPKYGEYFRQKLESQINEEFLRFYAMNPAQPVFVTHLLSVITISFLFLSAIGLSGRIFNFFKIQWILEYLDLYIFVSTTLLIVYCIITVKKRYDQLNINLEIQKLLQKHFLN